MLTAECILIFFIVPPSLYFWRDRLAFKIIPLVLATALIICFLQRKDRKFAATVRLISARIGHVKGILLFFVPAALGVTFLAYQYLPELFFRFPRLRPASWLVFLVLYPLLAAYPQEIIFRAFFFHRYGRIFPGLGSAVFFNALSFSLAHAVYFNWVAFGLTFLGGILFAFRYLRTGSLFPAVFEHALWGDFLFTIGLGWFLYSGSIG